MLIHYNPHEFISESSTTVCAYHLEYPGANYAGCTCSGTYSVRAKTAAEIRVAEDPPEPLFGTNIREAIKMFRRWRAGR